MSERKRLTLIILVVVVAALVTGASLANVLGYSLDWWTVAGGGGESTGGQFTLNGTAGQSQNIVMEGGDFKLGGGFWGGGTLPERTHTLYLPLLSN
jgi:hypothetical protein